MTSKNIVIANIVEAYNNPIAELVQVACGFESEITLESDNRRVNAKSIMGIMAFGPSEGIAVHVVTNGKDEVEAMDAIERFLTCKK